MLEIKQVNIKYFKKDGGTSSAVENIKHIKILPYLSIVQSLEGSYDIALGNGAVQQTGNKGFFIAPANVQQTIVHHVNPKSGKMVCRWLFIDAEINNCYPLDALYCFPVVLEEPIKQEMAELFDSLFTANTIWEHYSCCYKILGLLFKTAVAVKKDNPAWILKTVDYMKNNYMSKMDISQLAKLACTSESNFYVAFKKHLGVSPIAYLNRYRLSLAAELLAETTDTVKSICSSIGIPDAVYFHKLFKRAYGMSPREYRLQYKST